MSRKFVVSAPGKIILHGEHSVVYNKPAIAGPIGLRTYLELQEITGDLMRFEYKRLDLEVTMKLESANLLLSTLEAIPPPDFLQKLRISKEFILKFVEIPRQLSEKEEMAIAATLFILHRIFKAEGVKEISRSFAVSIDSDMSIGAGVGSSASYGVCLAAGFFIRSQLITGKVESVESYKFSEENLERISQWAFDSEVIMHEKPSGIDNTICTFGQLVKFNKGEKPQPIKTQATVDILLVDTKVSRSTSHVVGKVADFRNRHGNLVNSIFDAMGFLVDDVVKILEGDGEKFQKLSELVTVNNNLLRAIGASHPRLEKVFAIAEGFGFNAKLTGAGAGGCAFVLLPPNYEKLENFEKMCGALKANNYDIMATIIGGRGVNVEAKE